MNALLQQQVGQDNQSERLYRRWVGDLLLAARDDLKPRSWDRLMADIRRASEAYEVTHRPPRRLPVE